MKIINNIEQGSMEWINLRIGKVTGTSLADVMGSSLERTMLIAELIAEEGTESAKATRPTPEMERGSAEEIFAIKTYEKRFKKKIDRICMCFSDEFKWFGFSPDGLIKDKKTKKYKKAVEVKSPDSKTAVFYRLTNLIGMETLNLGYWTKATKEKVSEFKPSAKEPFMGIPADYKWQVVASFIVNEDQEELDFLVYDARFIDEEQKLYVVNVRRDDPAMQQAIQEAREELVKFRKDWLSFKEIVLPTNF